MAPLAGKRVLVTGAARGLGAALSLALAEAKCDVVMTGRDAVALGQTAEAIAARTERCPTVLPLDLTRPDHISDVAAHLASVPQGLDVLIHNGAGWLAWRDAPYTAEEVSQAVNSSITGTFLLTQALLPLLHRSAAADVLTIGSCNALPGAAVDGLSVPFYVAKQGQRALMDAFSRTVAGRVRWTCVHPPNLADLSVFDESVPGPAPRQGVSSDDVVEAARFALTRPRHVGLAEIVMRSTRWGDDALGVATTPETGAATG